MDDRIRLAVTPEADIRVVASNPLGSLDWPPQGFLSGLNLGVLDALDSIKAPTVHPLGSLDWPLDGLLSGLNLGVLDALDDTKAVTSRLLGDLDWPPFLAIPNPAPVCPKRQRSVHRFGEPETPLDVCHHHDILDSFDNQITFTGLVRCTRELFAGGHYSLAVEKAFVYVENLVKKRSGVSRKYGSNLMKTVFSVQNPFIKLNAGVTDSDRDEQLGYMEVFAGAMTGIRNPRAHAHDWIDEPKEALELLGSVDISPQPDESGGEVQEAQVSGVQLLKPGEYPAIVLDLVDEAFHQMTLPVQMPVIVGGCLAVRAGRNDRHHTQFQDVLAKLLGIVPLVGQYVLASITGDQFLRLGDVVLLPPGQDESQGVAQAVHAHVNLGAEPAAAPAQGLGRLATLFGGAPAAQGCARTTVLSMIRYSRSASSQQC